MILIILISQIVMIGFYFFLLNYINLFKSLFWIVLIGVLIAFIPNALTSLALSNNVITYIQAQIFFNITGALVITFLWQLLKDIKLE